MKKNNNYYWMYSKHSIESALLNRKRKIIELMVEVKLERFYREFLDRHKLNIENINFKVVNKSTIIKKIGSLAKYQGVALLVEKINFKKNTILKDNLKKQKFIVIIDQLNDPKNLGSILRISYAFGVKTIIVLDRFMPEENGYIASIAAGTLDKINIYKVSNLINTITFLKKNSWWILGLEAKSLEKCIDLKTEKFNFDKKVLIVGSENKGLRSLVRDHCDILYRIQTKQTDLDSINVVQATSIALFMLA
tara:strand:- start:2199 stop:2948 length:750 start_codon:yes stop_codon:yes gene_type:complete